MRKALLLVLVAIILVMAVHAETNKTNDINKTIGTNFLVSSLNASNVDCKKCHIDVPHIIHAQKQVSCENCHGNKTSVTIPQCTKCHDGPIHKVHAGKIEKGCQYCHKNITSIHTNLIGDTVCSHCHKDLIQVHGENQSCAKCHKTPPEIVKPLKAEGMTIICQDCHPATSMATIHGNVDSKQGCYNCHRGASKINGSEIPHTIHQDKASCKYCHEENGKVVVPQCTKCHKIDELHAFNKIGKLTAQSGLRCSICHADIVKSTKDIGIATAGTNVTEKIEVNTNVTKVEETVKEIQKTPESQKEEAKGPLKVPGFDIIPGIAILYIVARKVG